MIVLLLTLQIAAQAPAASGALDFSAHLIDGSTVEGTITGWQDGMLTISTAGKFQTLAVEQIARLSRTSRRSVETATQGNSNSQTYVGLRDGSTFKARSFKFGQPTGNNATSTMVCRSSQVTLPNKHIQYVRFREWSHALAQQWQELLDTRHDGDVIVIRRSAESLDYLEGIIRTITPKNVQFEFDGDTIEIPELVKLATFFDPDGNSLMLYQSLSDQAP